MIWRRIHKEMVGDEYLKERSEKRDKFRDRERMGGEQNTRRR